MAGYFLNLTITTILIPLGFGGFFLYDSVSNSEPSQLPEVLAGALLVALSLVLLYIQLREGLRWMRAARDQRHRGS